MQLVLVLLALPLLHLGHASVAVETETYNNYLHQSIGASDDGLEKQKQLDAAIKLGLVPF